MSDVQRWRRKPDQRDREDQIVARYEPGQPLDPLLYVARMADARAEMAEVPLPSGTVLLVRWTRVPDDHPSETEYEVIKAAGYLAYSRDHGSLYDTDDGDLRQWYDVVPDAANENAPPA
jgi:hypothetical protein